VRGIKEVAMSDGSDGVLFAIRVEERPEACLVTLEGEMDAPNAAALEDELLRIEATGVSRIVLDLSSLELIVSTGLAVILRAHERAEDNGHAFGVRRPRGHVLRTFELSGLDQELDFVD